MKSTLTVTYELPEEESEMQLALKAHDMFRVLRQLDEYLRGKLKYAELSDQTTTELTAVRRILLEGLDDMGLAENY